jgi:hypothetical protein
MAEKSFQTVAGIVQQFPDQDVVAEKEAGDQVVREFTIKSITTNKLGRVTLWPNIAPDAVIEKGAFVSIDATVEVNGDYVNITARELVVVNPLPNEDRDDEPAQKKTVRKKDTAF